MLNGESNLLSITESGEAREETSYNRWTPTANWKQNGVGKRQKGKSNHSLVHTSTVQDTDLLCTETNNNRVQPRIQKQRERGPLFSDWGCVWRWASHKGSIPLQPSFWPFYWTGHPPFFGVPSIWSMMLPYPTQSQRGLGYLVHHRPSSWIVCKLRPAHL